MSVPSGHTAGRAPIWLVEDLEGVRVQVVVRSSGRIVIVGGCFNIKTVFFFISIGMIWQHSSGSASAKVMACCPVGAEPSPISMLTFLEIVTSGVSYRSNVDGSNRCIDSVDT